MEQSKKVYLSPPHMGESERLLVEDAFQSNWIAPLGPHVDAFEKELADYVGINGAVALGSGTAAIHLSLKLLEVGKGDTVFCSTLTFAASCFPILYEGAIPVLIDSEPESWNMSPLALERAFHDASKAGKMPKAVIIVNLYGQSADMTPLLSICDRYGVPVIEDAAESLGATYKGKASGTFGKFGIYSFNGNKIITTSGGGMLVSNHLDALDKARYWATQARDPAVHYQHSETGYNYRLSNILAAIGRGQLRVLDKRVDARRRVFETYREQLSDVPGIHFMPEASHGLSTRWLTAMTIDPDVCGVTAARCVESLAAFQIEARPVWKPMHLQPLFQDCFYYPHREGISVSDKLFAEGICLPSGSDLSEEDQNRVIDIVRNSAQRAVSV
ncbi:MAG: pyridoxal phosphate-dependent aminotransferase [Paenibacillus sp.]|jgi:pyridoxal phosphate-dependent aminotransferase EpsN|uniref:Pyridoxal phosphate-dependent aminotransferase n=1 Tax=Paenibacillus hemerocallicola TaxID=1172614 RepID=A0A5C4TDX6_9BACL|nr:DegT/DnrJ/EryC1/StrS family aminotransferase [Paenibacillus hemerocallicola]MDF2714752.1 pyridoxal phosphate-dependent aminotransferase [Paenibacillus sp.]TNJ66700.1 pyridoxal phosphate-dependent aminotransferase [Paenibacillus hemerocallicola]